MTEFAFPALRHPIVLAPLAGGPSTPQLAAAVSAAGGLGFLAAGYRPADALRADIEAARSRCDEPLAVNLFYGGDNGRTDVSAYALRLEADARALGASLGEPRHDDDDLAAKLDVVCGERPAVVSFTFGCPAPAVVERLHERGIGVWVTVTEPGEALDAAGAGADTLVCQGLEAGGHRGSFRDEDGRGEIALLPLLALVREVTELPLVAAGGVATGRAVAAVLAAGARAAAIGTAFMRCPEAGTHPAHAAALADPAAATALTRAFTGRRARGIVNRFMTEHPDAPSAYPEIHHLTAPLRAAARAAGDAGAFNLWAGQAHALAQAVPAGQLVARLAREAA
jgi:nitronate monooxygenase